jgi:hypothetical protein
MAANRSLYQHQNPNEIQPRDLPGLSGEVQAGAGGKTPSSRLSRSSRLFHLPLASAERPGRSSVLNNGEDHGQENNHRRGQDDQDFSKHFSHEGHPFQTKSNNSERGWHREKGVKSTVDLNLLSMLQVKSCQDHYAWNIPGPGIMS